MTPGATSAIRVAVVDDQPLLVSAFSALVGAQPDMEVVLEAVDGRQAVDRLIGLLARAPDSHCGADLVLMDLRMPVLDGVGAIRELRAAPAASSLRILVLTTFDDDDLVLAALGAGAHGFLLKDSAPEEIVRAVLAAADGGTTISPTTASRLVAHHLRPARTGARSDITGAEQEVLALLCEGYSNAEIAQRLVVAESTVKTHVSHLMRKYGAASRLKLVVAVHREREAAL